MSHVIRPTNGRKVWFWRSADERTAFEAAGGYNGERVPSVQPEDAVVAYVWSDRLVNLQVRSHNGVDRSETSVLLTQPDDPIPGGQHCQWMPFQVSAAKK